MDMGVKFYKDEDVASRLTYHEGDTLGSRRVQSRTGTKLSG